MRLRATAIGWRAHAALGKTGGRVRVIARLSGSCYAMARDELLWLGRDAALHPRAVLLETLPPDAGDIFEIIGDAKPWRPRRSHVPFERLRDGARALRATVHALGPPRGLGPLLISCEPRHDAGAKRTAGAIVARARGDAVRVARACAAGDAAGLVDPALALLGLGGGLTPSGDDYVGGALFARRIGEAATQRWSAAIGQLLAGASSRTHPISACLLGDLANGEGWAPLYDLTAALACRDDVGAHIAARELVALGSSSGWDVFAGFLGALTADL